MQSLYVGSGLEETYKTLLDFGNRIVTTFTNIPTVMDLPIAAVNKFGLAFASLANIVTTVFGLIKAKVSTQIKVLSEEEQAAAQQTVIVTENAEGQIIDARIAAANEEIEIEREKQAQISAIAAEGAQTRAGIARGESSGRVSGTSKGGITKGTALAGLGLNIAGLAASTMAAQMSEDTQSSRTTKAWLTGAGSTLKGAGMGAMFGPWGIAIGAALGGIVGAFEAVGIATEDTSEKINRLKTAIEETGNTKLIAKNELKTLKDYQNKLEELRKSSNNSVEDRQAWLDLNNEIAAAYPELISYIDAEGNSIVQLGAAYETLLQRKQEVFDDAFIENGKTQLDALSDVDSLLSQLGISGSTGEIVHSIIEEGEDYSSSELISDTIISQLDEIFQSDNKSQLLKNYIADIFGSETDLFSLMGALSNSLNGIDLAATAIYQADFLSRLKEEGNEIEDGVLLEAIGNLLYNYAYGNNGLINFSDLLGQIGDQINLSIENLDENAVNTGIEKAQSIVDYRSEAIDNLISTLNASKVSDTLSTLGLEDGQLKQDIIAAALDEEFKASEEYATAQQDPQKLGEMWKQFIENTATDFILDAENQFSLEGYDASALNQAYENLTNYSLNQIADLIGEPDFLQLSDDQLTDVQKAFKTRYQELNQIIIDQFMINAQELGITTALPLQKISASSLEGLTEQLNQIQKIIQPEDLAKVGQGINNVINDILESTSEENIEQAIALFNNADLTSLTGIYDLIKALNDIGVQIDQSLIDYSQLINVNLTPEFASLSTSLSKNLEDFDKAISSASKGMDAKDAIAMAQKLGTTLKEGFRFEDGKYYLDNVDELKEAYLKYNEGLYDRLTSDIDNLQYLVDNKAWGEGVTDAQKEQYNRIIANYAEQWNALSTEDRSDYADFGDYLTKQFAQIRSDTEELINNYTEYQINSILIANGQIQNLITNLLGEGATTTPAEVAAAAASGNFDQLPEQLQTYAKELWDYYNGAQEAVFNTAIDALESGEKQMVQVNDQNKAFLEQFAKRADGTSENLQANEYVWLDITKDQIPALQQQIAEAVAAGTLSGKTADDLLAKIYNANYENNYRDAFEDILNSYDGFGYETLQTLAKALGQTVDDLMDSGLFKQDALTGNFSATADSLKVLLQELENTEKVDPKILNELKAQIADIENETNSDVIVRDIIENRESLSATDIASLATMLNLSYEQVLSFVESNGDGTYRASLDTIENILIAGQVEISEATQQLLAEEIDNIIESVTGLISNQAKGYTSMAEMQSVVNNLKNAGLQSVNGVEVNMQNLFEWSDTVHAFVLNTTGMIAQVVSAKSQLDRYAEGSDEYFVYSKVLGDMQRQFAEQVDIMSFIGAENKTFEDYGTESAKLSQASQNLVKGLENYNKYLAAIGESAIDVNEFINSLKAGGTTAIQAAQQWAEISDTELSASDLQEIYRAQVAPIVEAVEELVAEPGTIVSETAGKILAEQGAAEQIEGTSQYLVTGIADLYEAYNAIYEELAATGEATLSELNNVRAQAMEAKDGQQRTIDILNDAASMTYTRMAEILSEVGYEFSEELIEQMSSAGIIEQLGGANLRIIDFDQFAKMLDLQTGSAEYWDAYDAYNDAMIELDHQMADSIMDEVSAIAEAKPGDRVNLTKLTQQLVEVGENIGIDLIGSLNAALSAAGLDSNISNGILKIANTDNLVDVIQTISQYATEYGGLLESDIATLADAIDEVLQSFTDAVASGIEGTLSNADAQELKTNVKNMLGIDLDFTETADGLKISRDAAIDLYTALSHVNTLAANTVFDALSESLQQTGEDCENISKTMANIAKMEKQLGENPDNSKVEERLNLYRQIAATQMQDSDSYDFMGQDLPEYLQGPENYWNSIGQAYEAMNEAFDGVETETNGTMHLMAIDDFYNIITEMSNLANISGSTLKFAGMEISGDAEETAALIEKGLSALTNVDGDGVKVNLGEIGFDFESGAEDMSEGFDDAIKSMAQSQIDMLDAMIQMLEAVVAMEELGDIDLDGNGIEFDELFTKISDDVYQAIPEAQAAVQDILDLAETNTDLSDALDNIKFNNTSLRTLLEQVASGAELTGAQANVTFAALQSLYSMSQSGNYNLDDLMNSIADVAAQSGFVGEIEIGDTTIAVGYGVATQLEKNENDKYVVNGQEYSTLDQALQAAAMQADEDIGEISIDAEGNPVSVISTHDMDIEVHAGEDGKLHYTLEDGSEYTTKNAAVQALYNKYEAEQKAAGNYEYESFEQFTAKLHLTSTIEIADQQAFEQATHDKIVNLAQALANGSTDEIVDAAAQVGISVDVTGELTEAQRQQISELAGIESKTVTMDVAISTAGTDSKIAEAIESGSAEATLTVTLDDQTGLNLGGGEGAAIESATSSISDLQITGVDSAHYDSTLNVDDIAEGNANVTNLTVGATNFVAGGALASLQGMNFATTSSSLTSISSTIKSISGQGFSNFEGLSGTLSTISGQVSTIWTTVQNFANQTFTVDLQQTGAVASSDSTVTRTVQNAVEVDTSAAQAACRALSSAASAMSGPLGTAQSRISALNNAISSVPNVSNRVTNLVNAMNNLPNVSGRVSSLASAMASIPNAASRITTLASAISSIPIYKNIAITATVRVATSGGTLTSQYPSSTSRIPVTSATGNVALAKGTAKAGGTTVKTLMGELGPELVVSRGEYFVVGENGPEMFDLPDDAIVFNHLQTKRLLTNGSATGRGKPVKSEKASVALAGGNTNGPAMASAKSALGALKQIRAMWQSMLNASAKDLGSQAGRGSGSGGGGSSDDDDDTYEVKTTTAEIQRWYNLLRQISKIEEQITHQNNLQDALLSSRIANGEAIYKSQRKQLALLSDEIQRNRELADLQKSWYDNKRAELADSSYGLIFTYDEEGLQQYVDGQNRGLDILEKLTARDVNGKPTGAATSAKSQLDYLKSIGFNINDLVYNDDGTRVFNGSMAAMINPETGETMTESERNDAYTAMMENFWDNLDGWRDELDGIYDSYNEQLNNVLENESEQNEILQAISDNQLAVEDAVLNAIIDREQAVIDKLQDQRDALEEASQKYIDGLQTALNKEKEQYDRQKDTEDLEKLRRQVLILQRSGGSATQIRNLQDQLRSKEQDAYFQAQQDQIDAIQEASDRELERLDAQIDLLTETLEFQKENGLLWNEVQQIMQNDVASIADFIHTYAADWDSKSALSQFEEDLELKKQIGQWTEYRDDDTDYWKTSVSQYATVSDAVQGIEENQWETYSGAMKDVLGDKWTEFQDEVKKTFDQVLAETGDSTQANAEATKQVQQLLKNLLESLNTSPGFSSGGAVEFTGLAMLHGTPNKPEYVLNSDQYEFLKDSMLNGANTMSSALNSVNSSIDGTAQGGSYNTSTESVIIEHAEVNMNIDQIANDYDAQQAGAAALEEMLKIARKSTSRSVSRR